MIVNIAKCDAGSKGPGGVCDCSELEEWAKGKWSAPFCNKGKCRSDQSYDGCVGKKNNYWLGDGRMRCMNDKRTASCLTKPGKRI